MASQNEFTCAVCSETFDSREALEEHGEETYQEHDPEESTDQP